MFTRALRKAAPQSSEPPASRPNAVSDELLCPITLELPVDPVTAEDGRIYERSAIEEHMDNHRGSLKSPVTNLEMGRRLFPAPQIKSLIRVLIERHQIEGDVKDAWMTKERQEATAAKKPAAALCKDTPHRPRYRLKHKPGGYMSALPSNNRPHSGRSKYLARMTARPSNRLAVKIARPSTSSRYTEHRSEERGTQI